MHLAKQEVAPNRKENYFLTFVLISVYLETNNAIVLCLRIVTSMVFAEELDVFSWKIKIVNQKEKHFRNGA